MSLTDRPRLVVRPTRGGASVTPVSEPGTSQLGPLAITVAVSAGRLDWSVANTSDHDVALDAVGFAWDAGPAGPDPCCFSHGYQSWSPTRTRRIGVDRDPSLHPGSIPLVRAAYHADPQAAAPGEVRSEQVTVLHGSGREYVCAGFDGGERHAGTMRIRRTGDRLDVVAEAWLGGAVLRPGTQRALHSVIVTTGDDPSALLESWATLVGRRAGARTGAPFQVGWCSWYHYFHEVTEDAIRANLARAPDWPFSVFQLDDGYQAAIGDWLTTTDAFPSGIDGVVAAIRDAGYDPGIWIAPFLAAPGSEVARLHPDWLARAPESEGPAIGMVHEVWGGLMWQLDTTHPGVREHLSALARDLVDMGYRYLKLDFTFSPGLPARVHDPTSTPAERVRAGYDAIRDGAGDDAFILGCGAPLGPLVGVVDGMRIGADVAPWWSAPVANPLLAGYEDAAPATRHAFTNTLSRAFQHRRLWLNDPDCLMLRTSDTALTPEAIDVWCRTVAGSGGLVLVSDDLGILDRNDRARLDDVIDLGRHVDEGARAGRGPRCPDILDPGGPTTLQSGDVSFVVDPSRPRGVIAGGEGLSDLWRIRP